MSFPPHVSRMLPAATLFNVNKSGYRIVCLSFFTFLRLKGIYKVCSTKQAGDSGGGGNYRTMLCWVTGAELFVRTPIWLELTEMLTYG